MPTKNNPSHAGADRKLVITRIFAAPRDLVFKAWIDPMHLEQWWGPEGFTNPVCEADGRPGGAIRIHMRGPDGTVYPMAGTFQEIDEPERIVFTAGALDDAGQPLFTVRNTVTFAERNGQTTLTLEARVVSRTEGSQQHLDGMEAGWTQSLERLATHLPLKSEPLVIERIFDAPAALVWKAITTVEDLREWSFDLDGFKPEVGFAFRFHGEKDGTKFFHRCKVTEVIPGKKLAYSWRYEGHAGDSLVTFELFAAKDKTRLRLTHAGLETFPKTPDFKKANFVYGWTALLGASLRKFVESSAREIVIVRVFAAPRELVWNAWTDPKQVVRWWGPRGFTTTIETMDVKPGGTWKHIMHGPDGTDYPNESVFTEVVKPERILFSNGGGKKGAPAVQFESTWTFEALGDKTKVTIRMVFPSAAARDVVVREYGAIEGGHQTLERLEEYLSAKPA